MPPASTSCLAAGRTIANQVEVGGICTPRKKTRKQMYHQQPGGMNSAHHQHCCTAEPCGPARALMHEQPQQCPADAVVRKTEATTWPQWMVETQHHLDIAAGGARTWHAPGTVECVQPTQTQTVGHKRHTFAVEAGWTAGQFRVHSIS